ncbi:MAG: hypothetical protein WAN33_06690 [Candidatus Acidiferrales bacterium]
MTLVVLVLLVLASAVGLRNLSTSQQLVASTGNPVPILPDNVKLFASTGNPVPILPDGKLFASTGNPVPILPDGR